MELSTMMRTIRKTMTEDQIAAVIGSHRSTVNRIANGRQRASYELGKRIEALYSRVNGGKQ